MTNKPFHELVQSLPAMLEHAGHEGVVLGTIGAVEFNLCKFPFPGWSTREDRLAVAEELLCALHTKSRYKWGFEAEMEDLQPVERLLLIERGQLSPSMNARRGGVHVLINDTQDTECFINDEEHFLFQHFFPGEDGLKNAQKEMKRQLAAFSKRLPIAHDRLFGYLMSDPSKGGEATFFMTLFYMPALRMTRRMEQVTRALDELEVFLSPFFPHHREEAGDLYLLHSPTAELGKLNQACKAMLHATEALCSQELRARSVLMDKAKEIKKTRSAITQAFTRLTQAPALTYRDTLNALSLLRLGIMLKLVQVELPADEISRLISLAYVETAPAHMICVLEEADLSARRIRRARYTRELVLNRMRASIA